MAVNEQTKKDKSLDGKSNGHSSKSTNGKSIDDASSSSSWYTFMLAFVALPHVTISIFLAFYVLLLWASPLWLKTILVIYLLFIALDSTPSKGGYSWAPSLKSKFVEHSLRRLAPYQAMADYYPVRLVKTVDLPAGGKPYIFAYHPHGVIGVGACATLLTNPTDFDLKFPGIPRRIATLSVIFLVPIFRDWLLLMGFISASKSSLRKVLQRNESIVLLPGGAPEALLANPKTIELSLQRRKGFIKLAIEANASLVPVLGFGETQVFSMYNPQKGSLIYTLQQEICRVLSFSTPILLSPFPRPTPIHVVVGKPVEFDSTKSIEQCHAQYVKAVQDLYNQHKKAYDHDHIPLSIQ